MSHYTVLVRISAERIAKHSGATALELALADMMEPYSENAKDEKYLAFTDIEDEYREKYATESVEMWHDGKGNRYYTWDERFRLRSEVDRYGQHPNKPPPGYAEVEVPYNTLFKTFEEYMREFGGYKLDPRKKRYGYWSNPHGHWDWYKIGGRWTGFFPLREGSAQVVGSPGLLTEAARPGHGDIVKIADLDLPALRAKQTQDAREFWKKWTAWLAKPEDDSFTTGIRSTALDLGFLKVIQGPHAPSDDQIAIPWMKYRAKAPKNREPDVRDTWTDVAAKMTEEQFYADYEVCFHPLLTYAALDDAGWHSPGKMGWFGASHAEDGAKAVFMRGFMEQFINAAQPTDTLVLVDCHT